MIVALIDEEICIGCGMCEEACPEVFEIQNEKAQVISSDIISEVLDACYEAVENCPVDAITMEEED